MPDDRIQFVWDLMEEASERQDKLAETTDFRQDRIDWDKSVRPRLEQAFGSGDIANGFNNPGNAVSLAQFSDPESALDAARALYAADIRYLKAIRQSLSKVR
jgi:hypothetical protein